MIQNNKQIHIETFITDKDSASRAVIKKHIPDVNLNLCIFHVFKAVYIRIRTLTQNLPKSEAILQKQYIKNLIYSQTEEEYTSLLQKLNNDIRIYLCKNWDPIKNEFIELYKKDYFRCKEKTTSRAESFFADLKRYINKKETMTNFVIKINTFIENKIQNNDHILKKKYCKKHLNKEENILYYLEKHITPYAFDLLTNNSNTEENERDNECKVVGRTLICNQCDFSRTFRLPCIHQHSFYMNHKEGNLDLIIDNRWKRSHMIKRIFNSNEIQYDTELCIKTKAPTINCNIYKEEKTELTPIHTQARMGTCKKQGNSTINISKQEVKRMKFCDYWEKCKKISSLFEQERRLPDELKDKFLQKVLEC